MTNFIGKTISHYKILEKLGEGGMGVVYKALDTKLEREVALKVLRPEAVGDPDAKKRFIREARAASALNHPNITTIYQIDEWHGRDFICMEYLKGQTIKEMVESSPLPIDEVLSIATQVADALQEAHEHDIVHRDIKSENIMMTPKGQVKVMDFGLAKLKGMATMTKIGTTMGTSAYMSPEQARGEEVDHRTDIWSLGVLLYEMMTAQLPFKGEYEQAVIYSILNREPEPIKNLLADAPRGLDSIVIRALKKVPSQRYQHITEMLNDLKNLQETPKKDKTKEYPTTIKSIRRKQLFLFGGLTVFIVFMIFMSIYLLPHQHELISSIAVLPLRNLSDDPEQDWFAEQMTGELITQFSKISALRIISRQSVMRFKESKESLPNIAHKLNVDALVEGSVYKANNEIRIIARLIQVKPEQQLWAQSYDGELRNVLSLQSNVARAITKEIKVKLTPEEHAYLEEVRPVDPEAYEFYLRGRHLRIQQTTNSLRRSLEYFEKAIEKDSNYAEAYAGLAKSYYLLRYNREDAISRAEQAIEKALELNDAFPEAYCGLSDILEFNLDWSGAEKAHKRAIKLNPGNSEAHYEYGMFLIRTGRLKQALPEMKRALELDPLSLLSLQGVAQVYFYKRQYDQAIKYNLKALELDANFIHGYICLVKAYSQKRLFGEAAAILKKIPEMGVAYPTAVHFYAISGERAKALDLIDKAKELRTRSSNKFYIANRSAYIGLAYALLGEKDQAMMWLNRAYEENPFSLQRIKVEPGFDSLRSDPRFKELLKKMRLAE
ncbi:MAG: protein kinase [bacterium]|nr:MAG: protein kinase [bacterium]